MADNEEPREIPESANGHGKHDRVKRGYWPEKFGDQVVSIDIDHPQAHLVRSREELEAERVAAEREAAENAGKLQELLEREQREAEERELAAQIEREAQVEREAAAEKPSRRSR